MPSTYTTNLGIEKIATGEQSGTWGTTTNTNLDLVDEAVNGIVTVTLAGAGSSGSPNTLAITNGASSDGRNKYIEFNDGGDLGGTAYVQLTPNDAEKIVHIRNSLSASRSILIFQGTYNASNDFEIPNGADVVLKFDGAGAGAVVSDVNVNLTATKLTTADLVATTISATGDVDIADKIVHTGDTNTAIRFPTADTVAFETGGSEAMRIDSSQRVLINHTAYNSSTDPGLFESKLALKDTDYRGSSIGLVRTVNSTSGPFLVLGKGRGGDVDSNAVVQDDDALGGMIFYGDDGTDMVSRGALIMAQVDGTPGSNDMPGRIVFETTADGASSSTERMRITNDGKVGIGSDNPQYDVDLHGAGNSADGDVRIGGNTGNQTAGTLISHSNGGDTISTFETLYRTVSDNALMEFKAGFFTFDTGTSGSEAMRIDSSQRVLIGDSSTISSPDRKLQITGTTADNSSMSLARFTNSANASQITFIKSRAGGNGSNTVVADGDGLGLLQFHGDDGSDYDSVAGLIAVLVDGTPGSNDMPGRIIFNTTADGAASATERMRITEGGRVGMGGQTNPQAALHVGSTATNISEPLVIFQYNDTSVASSDFLCKMDFPDSDPSNAYYILFTKEETATSIGSVRAATSTSVSFLTTSDHRVKNNVQPLTGALDRLNQLNPVTFNWQDCGTASEGFIAHEAQEVVPVAVMGEKDAVNEDGSPDYQQIDYSKVVPLLTAALQEAITKIETLEARVATLEAN